MNILPGVQVQDLLGILEWKCRGFFLLYWEYTVQINKYTDDFVLILSRIFPGVQVQHYDGNPRVEMQRVFLLYWECTVIEIHRKFCIESFKNTFLFLLKVVQFFIVTWSQVPTMKTTSLLPRVRHINWPMLSFSDLPW